MTQVNSDLALKADKSELTNIKIQSIGATVSYMGSTADANNLATFMVLGTGINYPDSGFWYIMTLIYNASNKKQVAFGYKNNSTKTRYCDNGTWSSWA